MSSYQPEKRKRERGRPKKIVYILRGVPGTGKTTLAEKLKTAYENIGWSVIKINRDEEREEYIKSDLFKEIFGKKLDYQESFTNATANTLIRDKYYKTLTKFVTHFKYNNECNELLIIDSTHTKIADLVYTLNLFKPFGSYDDNWKNLNVFIITKRTIHGNIHNVPEPVMKAFKKELKESDEWLNKKFPKKEKVTLL